ncbi:MAG: ferrous iron transporter B [Candidatus Aenigmatarchaeota archaeon]|nr:MAG: ferrous iron transporter B [Candidatus Aenigmarchaeota archaeon]
MRILIMGNQNVGKSAMFFRLTGINVTVSNYPGTTVEFKEGRLNLGDETAEIIDVPGTYTIEPTSKAEEVAAKMLKEGDIVINVVDATNLERNLYLTLQLLERNVPVIVALNLWDEAHHKGIDINLRELEKELGVPVVPTVAVTGEGIKTLVSRIKEAKAHKKRHNEKERWARIGRIIKNSESIKHRKETLLERIEDTTVKPLTGVPIAIFVAFLMFYMIRIIGEGLITNVFDPIFEAYKPLVISLGNAIGPGTLHYILIGNMIGGQIDYVQSMGLLTTGLYVPIAMVLPYIFAFYLILGVLEDSGYLPRLATLIDTVMHRLGMHGLSIIPMLLGIGCNVPGALSTRILETKRQRFIAATLMAIAIPCMAQIAMIIGLVGRHGIAGLGIVFGVLFLVWLFLGLILNRIMKGGSPEIFMEIPPYRIPYWGSLLKKLWMRMKGFVAHAVPYVLLGVILINMLYFSGLITLAGKVTAPLVVNVLGLPEDAVGALIMGFLRKDVATGMLLPLGLSLKQLIIASVVLAMYFPCIATFVVLFRELGLRDMAKSTGIMIIMALFVGGLLNILL